MRALFRTASLALALSLLAACGAPAASSPAPESVPAAPVTSPAESLPAQPADPTVPAEGLCDNLSRGEGLGQGPLATQEQLEAACDDYRQFLTPEQAQTVDKALELAPAFFSLPECLAYSYSDELPEFWLPEPQADGETLRRTVELPAGDGMSLYYAQSVLPYGQFRKDMLAVFTPECLACLSGDSFREGDDGSLLCLDGGRGGNIFYRDQLFAPGESSDSEVLFWQLPRYADDMDPAVEPVEEVCALPVRLALTPDGWRVAELHPAY